MAAEEVEAEDRSIAAGRDVNIGISAEALLDTLKEDLKKAHKKEGLLEHLLEQQEDKVSELSDELKVTKEAVLEFLQILIEKNISQEQIVPTLRTLVDRREELVSRLHALPASNDDPEITTLREQAAKAVEEPDYDLADQLLEEAENIDRQAIIEQREALDRRQLSAATTLGQRGDVARARLNYRKAADHFAEAARLVPTSEEDARFYYLMKQASVLKDQGDEFGDNPALIEAIEAYQRILREYTRERVPLKWARTQVNLGMAFESIAKKTRDEAALLEGIDAIRGSLHVYEKASNTFMAKNVRHDLERAEALLATFKE